MGQRSYSIPSSPRRLRCGRPRARRRDVGGRTSPLGAAVRGLDALGAFRRTRAQPPQKRVCPFCKSVTTVVFAKRGPTARRRYGLSSLKRSSLTVSLARTNPISPRFECGFEGGLHGFSQLCIGRDASDRDRIAVHRRVRAVEPDAQAMRYCRADMERLCSGVPPGGGRIVRCLKAHKMEMSVGCAMTLRRIKARMGG